MMTTIILLIKQTLAGTYLSKDTSYEDVISSFYVKLLTEKCQVKLNHLGGGNKHLQINKLESHHHK